MIILTIRTDKPEAEIGLYESQTQLEYEVWHAHRQLAETIHRKINDLLKQQGKSLQDIEGVVVYKGPGSFTGLRIGMSVANALSYSLGIPVAARSGRWGEDGIVALLSGKPDKIALPEYGGAAHTTTPSK
jgi:tRNA threonylcarbamoyladenosine biosynthesis protein TsaB